MVLQCFNLVSIGGLGNVFVVYMLVFLKVIVLITVAVDIVDCCGYFCNS